MWSNSEWIAGRVGGLIQHVADAYYVCITTNIQYNIQDISLDLFIHNYIIMYTFSFMILFLDCTVQQYYEATKRSFTPTYRPSNAPVVTMIVI